jgi:multisubunit Na+/H+ antiporter MnhC subunit
VSDMQRPRPQFGEYATPEQQRKAIKVPLDDTESMPVESQQSPTSHISVQGGPTPEAPSKRATTDRLATMILLGIGLMTILLSVPALLDLPKSIDTAFAQLDLGNYTSTALGSALGWTALVISVALWGFALWLSLRALRLGRVAWWIPLVFGVIANIAVFACIAFAMAGDPAFTDYVNRVN